MTEADRSLDSPITASGGAVRLPRPPGAIRRFWTRHPRLVDVLVAAAYLIPSAAVTLIGASAGTAPIWLIVGRLVIIVLVTTALVLFRRRRPWLLIFVAWIAALLVYPAETPDVFATVLALYALAAYRSTREAWIGFGVSALVGTASAFIASALEPSPLGTTAQLVPVSATQSIVAMLIATLIGINVGNRRRYLAALITRVGDLARERDQQAQLATALERSRIAREMHDIVSHSLTVMVTLAEGSAAAVARDPARAAETMRRVAETGRDALTDMRRMLGVLAEPAPAVDDGRAPQPGATAMPELIERFRTAGLPVRYSTTGASIADPNLQLAVYRIVQEALTNTLRHAASAEHVDVSIEQVAEEVRITVLDDAVPIEIGPTDGGGHGLIGMRERVALYGGTIEVGPRRFNGWRVHAVLPVSPGREQAP